MASFQYAPQNLEVSSAKTATGDGTARGAVIGPHGCAFILDVTAAASTAADTLDVQIKTDLDETNYLPIVSFTQVLGNGSAVRHVAKITLEAAVTMFEYSAALAAGSTRAFMGTLIRPTWTIVDDSTSASFTFSISVVAI